MCTGSPAPRDDVTAASAQTTEFFFLSTPAPNGLVFIGAAGKRSNPHDTLRFALEDAAQRVAMYYSVYGEYAVENNIGSGAFDYAHNTFTSLSFAQEESKQYVDSLHYNADTDTIEIDNTFFIRTLYPSAPAAPRMYRPAYNKASQRPDWVDNPPLTIDGHEVGIGFSGRHSSLADTYANSCNNAIFAIIRNVNAASRSSALLYENTGSLFGYKTANNNVVYAYGTLTGFYVLDTWIDPKEKTVWTLAVAHKLE
jgi:hypothetical protein